MLGMWEHQANPPKLGEGGNSAWSSQSNNSSIAINYPLTMTLEKIQEVGFQSHPIFYGLMCIWNFVGNVPN